MPECTQVGCRRRPFMDTSRCFDHQTHDRPGMGWWLGFAFTALVSLAFLGVVIWAIIMLVTWLTHG